MKGKLAVERDQRMETATGLTLESCTAFVNGDGELRVYGELVCARSGALEDYREIQLVVFDADGDIVHREYSNWVKFGVRQSFQFEVDGSSLPEPPSRVKVYPSSGGY